MEFTDGRSAPRNNLPGKDEGRTEKGKAIGKRGFRVQDKCTLSLSPWGALGGDLHHIGCCYLVVPIGQGPYPPGKGAGVRSQPPESQRLGVPARWRAGWHASSTC